MQKEAIPAFLKWAGGKRRLISNLERYFPKKIDRYFEPFLGAGSMFFHIKQKYNPNHCEISDINKDLINTFIAVRDRPKLLIKHLREFKQNHGKKFYYEVRDKFNHNRFRGVRRCAVFIYLNKTCFNGLYRVNKSGEFNVPLGKYKNPEIFNEETIFAAHSLLRGVVIKHQDYRKILSNIRKNDFVYLDPCYDPIKRTSFVHYTPERFQIKDRIALSQFIWSIKSIGGNALLSNNDIPEIRKIYSEFNIVEIEAPRCINSDADKRGKIVELAISTYQPSNFIVSSTS